VVSSLYHCTKSNFCCWYWTLYHAVTLARLVADTLYSRLKTTDILEERVSCIFFLYFGATALQWAKASSFTRFIDHTQRSTTVGRTFLDEWSARRRHLYLTTHIYSRQTDIPPVGFEPTVSVGERPQTHTLDRAATGTGFPVFSVLANFEPMYFR